MYKHTYATLALHNNTKHYYFPSWFNWSYHSLQVRPGLGEKISIKWIPFFSIASNIISTATDSIKALKVREQWNLKYNKNARDQRTVRTSGIFDSNDNHYYNDCQNNQQNNKKNALLLACLILQHKTNTLNIKLIR